ncbi:MAG TPA: nucleotidyltransferase, partial [Planctomycetaceae bacterium]|nr:nucleotidyltransferase [Planctomycetaceae bacterium]
MNKRVHYQPNLIYSDGTQVVTVRDIIGPNGRTQHPRGSVGVVVRAPRDLDHSYRVKFPDGVEVALKADELTLLAQYKEGEIGNSEINANRS